jgi:hypothetical protein
MFQTTTLSPLNLKLDEKNPRFKVTVSSSQEDIREYMLLNEDLLSLAKKINDMGVLLPGERLVVVTENNQNIVLEGNRRTAIYQMFLDRSLVPRAYDRLFPYPNTALVDEISSIPVDLVDSRERAMPYLAARHIEGVRQWSSVSKWRISYDYYLQGKSAREIADILMLSPSDTKRFICNYKILDRGISSNTWSKNEREKLTLLTIEPDKLIRIFRTKEATSLLNLSFDEDFNLVSNTKYITKERLDKLITEFTRKAFIDNTLNTRSSIMDVDIIALLRDIIPELSKSNENQSSAETQDKSPSQDMQPDPPADYTSTTEADDSSAPPYSPGSNSPPPKTTSRQLPYFFAGLDSSHLDPTNQLCHGLLRLCREISIFSQRRLIADLPVCGAYLTRCLLEQSFKYYSKTHNTLNTGKNIWDQISHGKELKLSEIINTYTNRSSAANFISDSQIRDYLYDNFSDYKSTAAPLNWVIHDPSNYIISTDKLLSLPKGGLLALINYLIA